MKENLKEIYNMICYDSIIITRYEEIKKIEIIDKAWAFHNYNHIKNVTNIVENILDELGYNEELIIKAKIACLLHDTGAIEGKENHAYRSFEFAKKYFESNNINFNGLDCVLEAIKIHSDGFDSKNIIALSLILADKLDINQNRITDEGRKILGNRQYSHIIDITIKKCNNNLIVNFITDGKIDLIELNEYYFTKKVFKAINAFSNITGLKAIILLDNNEWKC